ncbi:flavin reductase family protein [Bacillus aerolatus]|uniref:Flavin reductase family protein n=1 Tax=Bacillus aerolatus TaxID=2653354 RepID=A0A6I1FBU4_9BACI|nr:flavin reductase family protein [Bacillus aerolatus]KAB7704709.1 flavin reductase family protein [Bacillus aerolatus]
MISIDPTANNVKENYKLMIGSIVPRPIAFVTTKTKDGTLNGAPFSYFNIVSANPPMVSLAIQRTGAEQKDTARNAIQSKEFVVHIVDEANVEKINETAATLPPDESEIDLAGLTPVDSTNISVPGIKEARIRMECVLEHAFELGGEDTPASDLLIGKVVLFHFEEDVYENGKINHGELKAVSRLAGADYAKVGEIFPLKRPK